MTSTPPEFAAPTLNIPPWPEDAADGFQPSYHRQRRKSRQLNIDSDYDNTTRSATTSPRITPSSLASPRIVPSASLSSPTPRTPILSSSSPNLLSKPRPSPKLSASSALPTAKTANAFALLDISNVPRYKTTIEDGSPNTSPHQSPTTGRRKRKNKSAQLAFPDHPTPPGSPLIISPSTSTTSTVVTPSSLLKNPSRPVSPVLGSFSLKTEEDSRRPVSKNSDRKPPPSSHHISNMKASSPTTTSTTTTTTTVKNPVHIPDPRDPSGPHELPIVLERPDAESTLASKTARHHPLASNSKLNTPHSKRATVPSATPPTPPITPPSSASSASAHHTHDIPTFTIWDYLTDELTASDFDTQQELKREKVANFLGVPAAIEKLMLFGYFVCLDSFLYTFTILPMRFAIALFYLLRNAARHADAWWNGRVEQSRLKSSETCDLLKGILVLLTCIAMRSMDASRLYHSIRGQAVIKLYVIFNVLEICDRLCCSFGTDILDALFSKSTLVDGEGDGHGGNARRHLRPVTFFLLALGYMLLHTMVLFFQMVTLNVAINFYSNELLTLLISNQFVEIKGSVFKKFERENLFQLSCSDIVERFQQSIFLLLITLRNVIELSESPPSPFSILPSTFVPLFKLPTTTTFDSLLTPVFMVIVSELLVDWLKHAFITKFNQIRPSVYDKYIDVLCRDLVVGSPGRAGGRKNTFVDQSPMVSRRIGFPALPLACVLIRIATQTASMIGTHSPSLTSSDYPLGPVAFPTPDSAPPQPSASTIAGMISFVAREGIWGKGWADQWPLIIEWAMWGGRMVMWGGGLGLVFVCLIAIKLIVGTNLLAFAYRRYATMQQRGEGEAEREKEMKKIEREEKLRPEFNDPRDNLLGVIPPKLTLDNVDRFSMVRSQIP